MASPVSHDAPQLRVLVLCNRVPNNPYLVQLLQALDANPRVRSVQHDTDWLHAPSSCFDIVHIQWPEAIFSWQEPSPAQLQHLTSMLDAWVARGARIGVTVHNEAPHGRSSQAFATLYRAVYERAHLFLHFGRASLEVIGTMGGMDGKLNVVVPHGNYDWFTRGRSLEQPPQEGPLKLLSFGRVRSRDELRILRWAADATKALGAELLIAGEFPERSRLAFGHYTTRMPFWTRRNTRLEEGYIPVEGLVSLMRESHAVIIPRPNNLNSGNVYLAFSFGRVVVGPDVGVIGEELRGQGNPVFSSADKGQLERAIESAFALAQAGLGDSNRRYAEERLAWSRIAEMHVNAYDLALRGAEVRDKAGSGVSCT